MLLELMDVLVDFAVWMFTDWLLFDSWSDIASAAREETRLGREVL